MSLQLDDAPEPTEEQHDMGEDEHETNTINATAPPASARSTVSATIPLELQDFQLRVEAAPSDLAVFADANNYN